MASNKFLDELKQRNLPRAIISYFVICFALLEAADILSPILGLPSNFIRLLFIGMIIGFFPWVILNWYYQVGYEGIKRHVHNPVFSDVSKNRRANQLLIGSMVVLAVLLGINVFIFDGGFDFFYADSAVNGTNQLEKELTASDDDSEVEPNSVAVLYFDNMSGDPSQDYFSDGITEEIISQLALVDGIKIRSRTSVKKYRQHKDLSIREIASELQVAAIFEGSVRKSGNRVRISAQLIDGKTDDNLWNQTYDFQIDDIFEVQLSVAKAITDQFKINIAPEVKVRLSDYGTNNPMAYDLLLKASSIGFTGVGIGNNSELRNEAKMLLRKAISLDPSYAKAYALLSRIYTFSYHQDPRSVVLDSALNLAQMATNLKPEEGSGYLAQGYYYAAIGNSTIAAKWYLKGAELNTEDGILQLADFYSGEHRKPEAMRLYQRFNKKHPEEIDGLKGVLDLYIDLGMSDSVFSTIEHAKAYQRTELECHLGGEFYLNHGFTDKALAVFDNSLIDSASYYRSMGNYYFRKGDWSTSLQWFLKSNYRGMDLGLIYMKLGQPDSATFLFERHTNIINQLGVMGNKYSIFDLGRIEMVWGDKMKGIGLIQQAFDLGWNGHYWIHTDPFFTVMADDPEVKTLVARFDANNELIKQKVLAVVRESSVN